MNRPIAVGTETMTLCITDARERERRGGAVTDLYHGSAQASSPAGDSPTCIIKKSISTQSSEISLLTQRVT